MKKIIMAILFLVITLLLTTPKEINAEQKGPKCLLNYIYMECMDYGSLGCIDEAC